MDEFLRNGELVTLYGRGSGAVDAIRSYFERVSHCCELPFQI